MPPAPPAFSTMTCWPKTSARRAARMRPMTSAPPPAANGTTIVSGRLGQPCAVADWARPSEQAAASAIRRRQPVMSASRCSLRRRSAPTLEVVGAIEPVDAPRVDLEDLTAVLGAESKGIDVALGVVEIVAGERIDAAHRAEQLRAEQDVVGRDDLEQHLDPGLMVDAGVEEYVAQQLLERRPLHVLREAAVAAPMIGHRASAVGNDHAQR